MNYSPIQFHKKNSRQGGYALITALIFFLTATSAVIAAISDAVFRETKTVRNESLSKQSYFSSESGAEDVAYRIKNRRIFDSVENYSFASTTVTVTMTTLANGSKNVVGAADSSGTKRSVTFNLDQGTGVSFPYALQSGIGGIDLAGGSIISGDIYTLGSIRGCGTCTVTGSAVAAGKSTSNIDQDNSSPSTPAQSISFGTSNSTQDISQSFRVSDNLSLTGLQLYVKKTGNPSNATINITTDNGGRPSTTILASGTLSSSLVTSAYAWMDITLTANPLLSSGTTYWIVIDANSSASNYYVAAANSSYGNGTAKIGRYGNDSWGDTTPSNLDAYFKISIGRNEQGIAGDNSMNPIPVGSAYSYNASYVNSTGPLYCQVGTDNNKICDTTRGDPPTESYPITDAAINFWKDEASASVYNGNYAVGGAGATIGPKKIVGNLSIVGGGTLQISGAVWVTGSITIDGGSFIVPANSTESYVIVTDGTITLTGGSEILGNSGSHILLVSTSTADPAVSINGGANDTVVFTPYGGLSVTGGGHVKAASALHISASGGSEIVYTPDVSMMNLTTQVTETTPFVIKSWKETE
jgi:hypothetical protein